MPCVFTMLNVTCFLYTLKHNYIRWVLVFVLLLLLFVCLLLFFVLLLLGFFCSDIVSSLWYQLNISTTSNILSHGIVLYWCVQWIPFNYQYEHYNGPFVFCERKQHLVSWLIYINITNFIFLETTLFFIVSGYFLFIFFELNWFLYILYFAYSWHIYLSH